MNDVVEHAVDPATGHAPPVAAAADPRLLHLFRHSLRDGQVNPLIYLLRTHRIEQPPAGLPGHPPAAAGGARCDGDAVDRLSAQQLAAGVRDLPALPAAVSELIATLDDDAVDATRLAAMISRDPALAVKTLRLANSSFYGLSRQVVSVADAAAILGLYTVRSVAIAAGLAASIAPPRCVGFDFTAFWRHTIGTALCAQALAKARHLDAGSAFLLGLLHDVGTLALASRFPQPYAAVFRHGREHDCLPIEAERAVLGTDHAAIGALIAEHWRLAPAVVEAIATHHAPPPGDAGGAAGLIDVVHVADDMAHALDLSLLIDDSVPPLAMAAWMRLGLDEAHCLALFAQVEAEHAALCATLLA